MSISVYIAALFADSTAILCERNTTAANVRWSDGQHFVTLLPVKTNSRALGAHRGSKVHKNIRSIDAKNATELGYTKKLKSGFLYLSNAWFSGQYTGSGNSGLSVSIDVSKDGIGYISTFLLTKGNGKFYRPIIIESSTPIKQIVNLCGSAT